MNKTVTENQLEEDAGLHRKDNQNEVDCHNSTDHAKHSAKEGELRSTKNSVKDVTTDVITVEIHKENTQKIQKKGRTKEVQA